MLYNKNGDAYLYNFQGEMITMKKKLLSAFLGLMFFMGRTNDVIAANTDYAYGYGYTVYAGIYSNYFEGSVTGSYSAGSIITLTGWYYNSSHEYVYAGSSSGSVYKYWSKPAIAVTWGKGRARGTVADGGSTETSTV